MSEDMIHGNQASGSVAERLLAGGFNVNSLKPVRGLSTNGVLRKDEWIEFDSRLVQVAEERLRGVMDLMNQGLTYNIPNGMGKTQVEWEEASDIDPAETTMDGVSRTPNDRVEFDLNSLPLPITHRDFYMNVRALEASRERGEPLDVTQADLAGRKVSERLENTLFNGLSQYKVGGGTVYGYTDYPGRATYTRANGAWDTISSNVGTKILDDVLAMIDKAQKNLYFGPFILYVPTNYSLVLQEDFKAESDKTIIQRVRELEQVSDVRVADKLADDNVVLVQMTRDVVDLVVGQEPTTVQWETDGGFRINFKAMAIMVPRLKQDFEGRTGIVHGTT